MLPVPDAFAYDHHGCTLVYGRGCLHRLGPFLADRGFDRALVVCGPNVRANDEVFGPVERALGDALVAEYIEPTGRKHARSAQAGLDAKVRADADVLIGLGGGRAIDLARMISALEADGRHVDAFYDQIDSTGEVDRLEVTTEPTPFVAVPTTFAGAGISRGGSLVVSTADEPPIGEVYRTGASDPRLAPTGAFFDPTLFETTPMGALAPSAMNGFNKGVEMTYVPGTTPITDALVVHGLRLLRAGLPRLHDDAAAMDRSVIGIMLVQFDREISVIHAFGHGFSRWYPVQQGVFHAILTPPVLEYVFDRVEARRHLLATGLGIDPATTSEETLPQAIIDEIAAVRDALDLPTRLRDVEAVREEDLPAIAAFIMQDHALEYAPAGLELTVEDVESVLRAAW